MEEQGGKKKIILCLAVLVIAAFAVSMIVRKMRGGSEEIIEADIQVIET